MNIRYGANTRVYTAAEVHQIKLEVLQQYEEKKQAVIAAAAADQLRAQMHLCLLALVDMGFQKIPLENFLGKVAEYADQLNTGELDFDNVVKKISGILGYGVDDPTVIQQICEENEIEYNEH